MAQVERRTRSSRDEALDLLRGLLERVNAELRDIDAKINQSRGQIEQQAERNAVIMGEVQRIQAVLDQTPRLNIKEIYDEALEVQQRLLTIRAQMEKLQALEDAARRTAESLQEVINLLARGDGERSAGESFNAKEIIMRVIDAQEEERERLARAMHDGPAHSLTNFILQVEICQRLFDRDPAKVGEELKKLKKAAHEAFQRVRSFIYELRPMMLTDLGLVPTVKHYLETFKEKTGIETELVIEGRQRRLEHYREVLIFRGIQALMANARDHSGATFIRVTMDMSGDRVRVVVEDNGRGFGTGRLSLDASNSEALGLGALHERVRLVDGTVRVDSVAGQGAKIEIDIPAGPEPEGGTPAWEADL